MPFLPDDAQLDEPQPAQGAGGTYLAPGTQLDAHPDANYRGSILPYSRDEQGNLNWTDTGIPKPWGKGTLQLPIDLTAGVPGAMLDAGKLPGDVYTGKQPTPYSGGSAQPDPALLARTFNMATLINPAAVGRGASTPAPSARALADAANAQYDAFRNSGLQVTGTGINRMLTDLNADLRARGLLLEQSDPVSAALRDLGNSSNGPYTVSPGVYDAAGLDAARQRFAKLSGGGTPQAQAASTAVRAIDDFTNNLPMNPHHLAPGNTANVAEAVQNLQNARANYGAAQRSDALTGSLHDYANTGILDRAVGRADAVTGIANLDAMIRSRVASFMQNPENLRGFSPSEIEALRAVNQGTVPQQALGIAQSVLGAGHGAGGIGLGVALGGMLSHLMESHPGIAAAAGGGAAAVRPVLGWLENRLAGGGLKAADEAVRSRSPLYQGQTAPGVPQPSPPIQWNWRTVPPSLLNQQSLPPLPQQGPVPTSLLNAGWA